MNDTSPGRICPLRYRYGASAIARAPLREVDTLYVIGGLYGNVPALDRIEAMARAETPQPTLCFNGDFNWFNIADAPFEAINRRVLVHDALQGNVEAEFDSAADDAGCGCAYPDHVDAGTVERSNLIHRQLKNTAARHPALRARCCALPMFARYRVGGTPVAVVHGDADSLAGWRFDVNALDDPAEAPWLASVFDAAAVDLFASSHTCLPAMRCVQRPDGRPGWVVNNGAAGMPNFAGQTSGLITRIGIAASPHPVLHELRHGGVFVALLPVDFDAERWRAEFLAQWPAGSAAWTSYFDRITRGPDYSVARARPVPVQAGPARRPGARQRRG